MLNVIRKFFDKNRYYNAVRKADDAFDRSKQRHYVVLQTDGELVIINRDSFRQLKKEKRFPDNVTIKTLEEECLYHTPYINGTGIMPEDRMKKKLERYLRWCKANREYKKSVKRQQKLAKNK